LLKRHVTVFNLAEGVQTLCATAYRVVVDLAALPLVATKSRSALAAEVLFLGVRILKTPVRAPEANAVCGRLVWTIRRECLDVLIPLGERHVKQVLTNWATYFKHARVHTSLGSGVPDPIRPSALMTGHRHRIPAGP
jgi:hypothetical protein